MTNEQKTELEQRHNVIIDTETMQYNTGDSEYGWNPIPESWTTMLMHTNSGYVASEHDWREDFENMDWESWGGKTFESAIENGYLVEVVQDETGDWVEKD